ncbi:MAG: GspE/PulE family protein [Patescibacteria group bacterium]|nr:GspE/PulE family protein [Patescibacteria group bacterium]
MENDAPDATVEEIDWQNVEIDDALISILPLDSLKKYRFVPFSMADNHIKVAVVDDTDVNTQNAIRFFTHKNKKKALIYPIREDDFRVLIGKIRNQNAEIGKMIDAFESSLDDEETSRSKSGYRKSKERINVLKDAPVAKMVEVIIKNAIDGRASDIHIEPMDEHVRVRYRVDGILYNSLTLPKKIGPAIVSRIKILSNLKIDEKRKPQDGRFRIKDLGHSIDFRVSSFPTSYGEKIVMRILDTSAGLVNLDQLGIEGRDKEILERVIEEPHGIILVTGPTGSGKSTTLYSVLRILNRERVNIVTLEDPVEYVLEGTNQSQVRPDIDYTFATGLRSILRQDPDVIMVGEIRDEITAELAIHAALTGHLVLSTLHTNSAIGAISRLVDMGIQPFLLSSSLKLLMAQRLVRRICPECKEEIKDLNKDAKKTIMSEIKKLPQNSLKESGITDVNDPNQIRAYHGKGCARCQNKGTKGRVGIYETVEITDEIGRMIGDGKRESEIEAKAREDGYTTMKQNGIMKIIKGVTTIEEVQRVTEDDDGKEAVNFDED